MKILVTGSKGYIAKKIIKSFPSAEVEGINRDNFDLLDKNKTDIFFKNNKFDVVIHTAIQGGTRLRPENKETFYNNLKMFYNLLDNKKSFKKFISLGSGAEIHSKDSFYGFSKKIINDIILNTENFYNVRIYGMFDHDEWDTRFIKSNILRYINKEKIIIHQDKFMDFFYMEDFLGIINNIVNDVENTNLIECCYCKKYKLSDIANIINNLDEHKVDIKIENNTSGKNYIGDDRARYRYKKFNVIGIEKGIKKTYEKLLK
jgi:nucleoside-diphosphate-sugar epimerase